MYKIHKKLRPLVGNYARTIWIHSTYLFNSRFERWVGTGKGKAPSTDAIEMLSNHWRWWNSCESGRWECDINFRVDLSKYYMSAFERMETSVDSLSLVQICGSGNQIALNLLNVCYVRGRAGGRHRRTNIMIIWRHRWVCILADLIDTHDSNPN